MLRNVKNVLEDNFKTILIVIQAVPLPTRAMCVARVSIKIKTTKKRASIATKVDFNRRAKHLLNPLVASLVPF